ncbi:hypothetical protein [Phenylobacterium sp.]|uniref:hypothetical protein n=1 Tax=Phenylobacterium sp. TaxID=1871053 RepID=UPI003566B0AE
MISKLCGAACVAAFGLCAASGASAKVMVATYDGVVSSMSGGAFHTDGVAGSAFKLSFKYDTDLGESVDFPLSQVGVFGGTGDAPGTVSPVLLASVEINGVRQIFQAEFDGSAFLEFGDENDIFHSASTCASPGFFCASLLANFHPTSMPADLTSRLDVDGSGDGEIDILDSDFRHTSATLALQHLTIAEAIPEPAIWVSLIGGLFGAGSMLRQQRGRRTPAAA